MAAAYTSEAPGHAESAWIRSIPAARARPANALARGSSAPAWPLRWHLAGFYRPWASGLGPSPAPGHRASGLSPRFHPDECSLTAALFRVLEGSVPHPHPRQEAGGNPSRHSWPGAGPRTGTRESPPHGRVHGHPTPGRSQPRLRAQPGGRGS